MADGSAPTEPTRVSNKFRITSLNGDAGRVKEPVYLFDEFWLEGETALFFGDSGKTTLAVHIAESISRGIPLWGEKMNADAQKVLYLDLQMTADQFRTRYSVESSDETGVVSRTEHVFSDNFTRVEMPDGGCVRGADDAKELGESLAWLVNETGARVLIIDSITSFRCSSGGTAGELAIVRELNRLKREFGLSILVVLNREVRPSDAGISVRDLGASSVLANFVDSVFAMGKAGSSGPYRYLKHLRSRGVEITYDGDHTPTFRIARDDGPFKFFEFLSFADEKRQFISFGSGLNYENLVHAFILHDDGVTIRQIADDLGLSKSKVHRLLQLERPPMPLKDDSERPEDPEPPEVEPDGSESSDLGTPEDVENVDPESNDPLVPGSERDADEAADESNNEAPELSATRRFKIGMDAAGDEILIEKEDERGEPVVWFKRESGGNYYRREKGGGTIFAKFVGKDLPGDDTNAPECGPSP
ncbi:MAG: AAA family ATPase [Acidobacteriota bacterium]